MGPTLIDCALPAALEMMSQAKYSGVLTITSADRVAWMAMRKGRILYATSATTAKLGDSLVAKGVLSQEVLESVLRLQRRKRVHHLMATILVELGLLSTEAASFEIGSQVRRVFHDVLTWEKAELMFESWEAPPSCQVLPAEDRVESLLLETAIAKAEESGRTPAVAS